MIIPSFFFMNEWNISSIEDPYLSIVLEQNCSIGALSERHSGSGRTAGGGVCGPGLDPDGGVCLAMAQAISRCLPFNPYPLHHALVFMV